MAHKQTATIVKEKYIVMRQAEAINDKSGITIETRLLKGVLWTYIIFCLVIAGLNYGHASRATPEMADFIDSLWAF